jgi:hypothetical protein
MNLRRLLWLIALVVLVCPPAIPVAGATGRAPPLGSIHCAECPPPPCPEHDTARHAAGPCCPLMSQVQAVLPPAASAASFRGIRLFAEFAGRELVGLPPRQEPPPPRV